MPTDAVDGENQVQNQNLGDCRRKPDGRLFGLKQVFRRFRIDAVVDFLGRLPDQEQAADDQNDVTP
jgi:hypothetical protein